MVLSKEAIKFREDIKQACSEMKKDKGGVYEREMCFILAEQFKETVGAYIASHPEAFSHAHRESLTGLASAIVLLSTPQQPPYWFLR